MSGPEEPTLIELAGKAHRGDAEALEALSGRLWGPVRRYLLKRLGGDPGGRESAADLTQEVLLRVITHLGDLAATTDGELRAWVLAIARRRFIDHLRQRSRDPMRGASPLANPSEPGRPERPGPGERALYRALMRAQARLPDATAQIFWLRLVSGAPWSEIGEDLGISEGAAKRRFQRGQQRLRRLVREEIAGLDDDLRKRALERFRTSGG